jgi:ferredoxin-NADP reductase
VNKQMIEAHLFKYKGPETRVLLCGPNPMVKDMCTLCEEFGYPPVQLHSINPRLS